jgi:hypothetical protein
MDSDASIDSVVTVPCAVTVADGSAASVTTVAPDHACSTAAHPSSDSAEPSISMTAPIASITRVRRMRTSLGALHTGTLETMLDALSIALPLVLAAVLIASAVAKLRTPDDLSGWADLGVPRALRREWLRRVHPWAEGALGVSLALLGGWLGLLAALVAVALMAAYTVLVVRVLARSSDALCACFGTRRRVNAVTVARNVWLTVLAVGAAAVIWVNPVVGGALAAGIPQFAWLFALAVAAVTTAFILWPETRDDVVDGAVGGPVVGTTEDELDYLRTRTPAVPVTLADGTVSHLRALTQSRPALLLAVSSSCGACETVLARRETYRRLMPEVDVRLLLNESPANRLAEHDEPQSLHDAEDYVAESLGYRGTPSAVLLGIDGMLAGGPVTGDRAVDRFVDDIYESLHGERPHRDDAIA